MVKIRKSSLFALFVILFPILNFFTKVSVLGYYDEVLGIVAIVYIFYAWINKKTEKIDVNIIILLAVITVIGLLSNIVSRINENVFTILVDVLWLWKPFACYLFFKNAILIIDNREKIISILAPIAKIVIIFTCAVAVVGQVADIGVNSKDLIYGIKKFDFFWHNGIQTGWLLFSALMILSASKLKKWMFEKYLTIAMVPLILTFSSLVYCWIFIEVFLLIILRKDEKIRARYFIVLAVGVCCFALSDIKEYFLVDSDSIRMTLIRYGIITANTFFPLGSGFATYGTEMASRHYSKLYVDYGWSNKWGLGREHGQYLNDTFFAGIGGQFGWFGFVAYLGCLYFLFKNTTKKVLNKYERVSTGATVITIAVTMIGSATAKSIMGTCAFSVLGIICAKKSGSVRKEQYNVSK